MSEELHATVTRTERLTFKQARVEPEQKDGLRGLDLRAAAAVVGDLARAEREAVLCVGPRRKWSDLERFDEEINEAEKASAALSAELAQAFTERQEEDARHTAELAAWLEKGGRGDKPASRADELDQRITGLQAELAAREMARVRLRERRAAHIAKHRKRFTSDMAKEVTEAETRYRRIVDELEQARRLTGREALWSDSDEGRAEAQRERETARRLAEQGHDPEKLAADLRGL